MLRITNGAMTLEVTSGAFKSYFKDRGFSVLDATETPEEDGVGNYHPDSDSHEEEENSQRESDEESYEDDFEEPEEEPEEDFSEIPLSEMSFEMLVRYADQLGLNHDRIRSKKELRQLIRHHLQN